MAEAARRTFRSRTIGESENDSGMVKRQGGRTKQAAQGKLCCGFRTSSYPGVAQLVARLLWEQDAAGSNPVTRTTAKKTVHWDGLFAVLVGFAPVAFCFYAGARARRFGGEPSSAAGGRRRTMVRASRSQSPAAMVYADGFCGYRHEAAKPRMPQVRILSLGPNKVDSFDTRVSETINLFLFAKMPVAQGFSTLLPSGLVSLWSLCRYFSPCRTPFVIHTKSHAETLLRGIVSA